MVQTAYRSLRAARLVPASGLVSEELRGGNLNGRRVHPGTPGESRGRGTLSGVLPSV